MKLKLALLAVLLACGMAGAARNWGTTSRHYNCGSGGDATTLGRGLDSLGNIGAGVNCTLIVTSAFSEASAHTYPFATDTLNGTLVITSSVAPLGVASVGNKINLSFAGLSYNIDPAGSGTCEIMNQNWSYTTGTPSGNVTIGAATGAVKWIIHNNIFNGRNSVTVYGSGEINFQQLTKLLVANNVFVNFDNAHGSGIYLPGQFANDTFVNNTFITDRTGFYFNITTGNAASVLCANNLMGAYSLHDCYWGNGEQGTGYNNASTDTTANGNWNTKANNKKSVTLLSEISSIDTTNANFALSLSGGHCADSGLAAALDTNSYPWYKTGARGSPRPHYVNSVAKYTIGADEYNVPPPDILTLTDLAKWKVYQQVAGSATISVSGTYSNGTHTLDSVQAQVTDSTTGAVVVNWTTITTSPGASTYTGTLSVPSYKHWMLLMVRGMGTAAIDTATGTNFWGVGNIYAIAGQSNATGIDSVDGLTAAVSQAVWFTNSRVWQHLTDSSWSTGSGYKASFMPTLANKLYAYDSVPVAFINRAVSGTRLVTSTGWGGRNSGTPADTTYLYGRLLWTIQQATSSCIAGVYWYQGETDAINNVRMASYRDTLKLLASWLRTDISSASALPFYIVMLARQYNNTVDSSMNNVRMAQQACDSAPNYLAACAFDQPEGGDSVHLKRQGYDTVGYRLAVFTHAHNRGPHISSVSQIGTAAWNLAVTNAGTALTPTTGMSTMQGYNVSNSTWTTADSTRVSGNSYNAYWHSPINGIRYFYGKDPTYAALGYDNQVPALPLEPLYDTGLTYTPPATISYASPATDTITRAATHTPTIGGGAADSCTVSPALPTGESITKTGGSMGFISGTPSVTQSVTAYTVSIWQFGAVTTTATISIAVVSGCTPANCSYTAATDTTYNTYTHTPTNIGAAFDSCWVKTGDSLRYGLTLNKTTGVISGSPRGVAAATTVHVVFRAVVGGCFDTVAFALTIAAPMRFLSQSSSSLDTGKTSVAVSFTLQGAGSSAGTVHTKGGTAWTSITGWTDSTGTATPPVSHTAKTDTVYIVKQAHTDSCQTTFQYTIPSTATGHRRNRLNIGTTNGL